MAHMNHGALGTNCDEMLWAGLHHGLGDMSMKQYVNLGNRLSTVFATCTEFIIMTNLHEITIKTLTVKISVLMTREFEVMSC